MYTHVREALGRCQRCSVGTNSRRASNVVLHLSNVPLVQLSRATQRMQTSLSVATPQLTPTTVFENVLSAADILDRPDEVFQPRAKAAVSSEEPGPNHTRKTKIICTIGPASCSEDVLEELAKKGMNVARLNMCHNTHEWHRTVIERIRKLNAEKGYSIAVMVDTEGSEIHTGELEESFKVEEGQPVEFTIRRSANAEASPIPVVSVSYDNFVEDVEVGDSIIIDGGLVLFDVVAKAGPSVTARCVDPGWVLSRANITLRRNGKLLRGRNSLLPVISSKDWMDIDFAISMQVDFLAISFVKTAEVINNLRSYIDTRNKGAKIELVAKIESYDSIPNVDAIIEAADAVMVARGDLGAQIPVEDVPSVQKYCMGKARQLGKPSIVAAQLLQSMIEYPIPTRAEVADVADVVRQKADALMLCSETAVGAFPVKSVGVLEAVARRMEAWVLQEKYGSMILPQIGDSADGRVSEELCASAAMIANNLKASAIAVFTRRGFMSNFLSRCRPDCQIVAFTDERDVALRQSLRWGVTPFLVEFSANPEDNIQSTFELLKREGTLKVGDLVVVVSDLRPKEQGIVRSVQVRHVQ